MSAPDRITLLTAAGQNKVTGIDFVYVAANQTDLYVFFHHDDPLAAVTPSLNDLKASQITIVPVTPGPAVTVKDIVTPWPTRDGRRVLRVRTVAPGGFVYYRLRIDDPRIDAFFNDVQFSFKASCPSELDCADEPHECATDPLVDFPVSYDARDFWSFRQALIDFASQRYPDWQDRLEADVGMVVLEMMAALGDEFAYAQDRIKRESHLATASQPRSLDHLARLVDYAVDKGCGAQTWLDVAVSAAGDLLGGDAVGDVNGQVVFEAGRGLVDAGVKFHLDPVRNELTAHLWDEDAICLPMGSTHLTIDGKHAADLVPDPNIDPTGRWVILMTRPTDPAVPERRWLVRIGVGQAVDGDDLLTGSGVTEIHWDEAYATPFEMDLETLVVHANLVPATSGRTCVTRFRVGPPASPTDPDAGLPQVVERVGANGSLIYPDTLPLQPEESQRLIDAREWAARSTLYLFSLRTDGDATADSQITPLVWLPQRGVLHPEIVVRRENDNKVWTWMPALIGEESAKPNDTVYTLESGTWKRVVGYRRPGREVVHVDYAAGAGSTVRFGQAGFGMPPPDGSVFRATFRLGNGRVNNVSADSLTHFLTPPPFVASVTNPLAATGGTDPETPEQIRIRAPQAFRAVTFRAVRPEDYAEAAERLDWVQKAGATLRWTGSWLTVFVTPDPRHTFGIDAGQRSALECQLDRFRQAGRETHALDPRYADLDLEIRVCVEPAAFRGEVEERVLEVLFGRGGVRPLQGFFDPDRFTFGSPLVRSQLEAVIQGVPGVRAVEGIRIRRRGWFEWRRWLERDYRPGDAELIRVAQNRLLPERGSVRILIEGGA